jgi:glycosyltransferase involved in cell wall biosynthesis
VIDGPSYAAVLVTYRRPALVKTALDAAVGQTRPPGVVIVVDNDADPLVRAEVQARGAGVTELVYVGSPVNGGPAGGLQRGLDQLDAIDPAGAHAHVLLLDDDDPLPGPDTVERLLDLRRQLDLASTPVGGIGLVGARWDDRRARLHRPSDDELHGAVRVDYLGGGQAPLYDRAALRAVGGLDASLFFGFDDLELAMRLAAAGYELFADGDAWLELRHRHGRIGLASEIRRDGAQPAWRAYYGTRNLILITRSHRTLRQSVIVTARPLAAAVIRRENLRATARGIVDGWLGRRGARIEPDAR